MQEPTEQTEITDEEAINIVDDGELTFDHVTFKYDGYIEGCIISYSTRSG